MTQPPTSPDTGRRDRSQNGGRVAVVAVHGVADQSPGDSVRQIANLLARLDTERGPCYRDFVEHTVRIPVRPLRPLAETPRTPQERDIAFTNRQLTGYKAEGPDGTYETTRIATTRATGHSGDPIDLDLYEMHWADLSRVGASAVRVLGELYQILLHLGSLGSHAAASAVGDRKTRVGGLYRGGAAAASWVLAGPIAVLNLFFIVGASLALTAAVPATWTGIVVGGVAAIVLTVAVSLLLMRFSGASVPGRLVTFAGTLLGAAAVAVFAQPRARWLLTSMAGAAALGVCALLLHAYRKRRPGIGLLSVAAAVAVMIFAAMAVARVRAGGDVVSAGLSLVEPLYVVLRLCWIAFFSCLWTSLVFGVWLWRRTPEKDGCRARVGRAVETTAVTLTLPAFGFLSITVALWAALDNVSGRVLGTSLAAPFQPLATGYLFPCRSAAACATDQQFIHETLAASLTITIIPAALLVLLAAVLAAWALGPVVWREVRPPKSNAGTRHLGAWLDAAFPALRIAGGLLVVAVAVVWPVPWQRLLPNDLLTQERLIGWIRGGGMVIAASAAGFAALRGRLNKLALGFRAPVDVLLDVDSYLRHHPLDATPRARIFARFASLLRLIGESGRYDGLVIIAHSQGSVITADLLRYIAHTGGLRCEIPPVSLFTMGSPLRQLYAWRFPELYKWAWTTSTHAGAEPSDLHRVRFWLNAYRSGDYVGRALWRKPGAADMFKAPEGDVAWTAGSSPHGRFPAEPNRAEFCLGAGAHTHYWDGTAPGIAVELDRLIVDCVGKGSVG